MLKHTKIIGLTACILLAGCASSNVRQYGDIDNSNKSITVPAGGGLTAELKDSLKQNHWSLIVDRGPNVIDGELGQNVHLESFGTFKTRYRMALSYNRVDWCIGMFDPLYNYNLSVIDNKTGEEVIVIDGHDCEHRIVNRFNEVLNKKKDE